MAIMDMVMEAMSPTPDTHFLQQMSRSDKIKRDSFNKQFGLGGYRSTRQDQDTTREISSKPISATEALSMIEDHARTAQLFAATECETTAQIIERMMQNRNSFINGKTPPMDYGLESDLADLEKILAEDGQDDSKIMIDDAPATVTSDSTIDGNMLIGDILKDGSNHPATGGIDSYSYNG